MYGSLGEAAACVTGTAGQGAAPHVLAWQRSTRRLGVLRATRSLRSAHHVGGDACMM